MLSFHPSQPAQYPAVVDTRQPSSAAKTWKECTDPDYDTKLDRIEYALTQRPERTFAFDEFEPLGIRPTAGSCWARQASPTGHPATYHRTHGSTYLHGCYSVGDDTLWGVNRRRKGTTPTWTALRTIRAARPDGAPIYVILDDHFRPQELADQEMGEEAQGRTVLHADQRLLGEPDRGADRTTSAVHPRQLHHPNHTVQTREQHRYLRWRNTNARHPDILAVQRRERARVRSERHPLGRPATEAAA